MTKPSYRMGPFLLDRTGYRVVDGDTALALTPKLLDLLFHLADHAGELVTKEALLDALWPGANVTDNALAQAVSELRDALGDEAKAPRFIKTIPRRGYRLLGAVDLVDAPGRPPADGTSGFTSELGLVPAARTAPAGRGRDTASLDAYRAFTEGWLRLELLDLREIPQAIADLERAVAADARYAQAYAGLASAEVAWYESTRSSTRPRQDLLERAVAHARQAAALDPSLAEVHATLALVLASADCLTEAAAAGRKAVAMEPANWRHLFRLARASWGDARLRACAATLSVYPEFAFSHLLAAMVHVARAQLTDAETILRQGAAVQDRQIARGGRFPALGLHWLLGLVRLAQDDVEEAIGEFDREIALAEPHRLYGREYATSAKACRAAALLRGGRVQEAAEQLEDALVEEPEHPQSHILLAATQRRMGASDAALASLRRAEKVLANLTTTRPAEAALVRAQVLVANDDTADAADGLRRFLEQARPGFAVWLLPVDPLLHDAVATPILAPVLEHLAVRAR